MSGMKRLGALIIDMDRYAASFNGDALPLTGSELELLAALAHRRDRVASRRELSDALGLRGGRSVDVLLSSLRQKLPDGAIRNVRARGWIIDADALER